MLGFLENRMKKTLEKVSKKISLKEEDILEVTRDIKIALLEADVNLKVVKEFINNVKEKALNDQNLKKLNPSQFFIKILHEELVNILGGSVKELEINKKPYTILMTGLQGSGKTTATVKLAYYLRKKKKIEKPLVVAADIYRPAAVEQLITLAKSVQIDYFEQGVNIDVDSIVENALEYAKNNGNDLIIIDTAGRLSVDEPLMNELQRVKNLSKPNEILFVADALSGQDIINVATQFNNKLNLTGTIITKLDSDARGGAALSLRFILNLPIKFIGTGEKVSNLDLFYPDRMADRILGMGDVLSLIEKAQENIDEDKATKMFTKMLSGEFTLDDLLEQIKQVKNLGKFSSILKMLPGNLSSKISDDQIQKAEEKIKIYQVLMSSMTKKERNNPKLLRNASRKERVIKGSGRSAQEFNKLMSDYDAMVKKMSEMAKKFKSGSFPTDLSGFGSF
ncbi:signal recognition particle protein [Mycoplasma leonicaptivi]|uniref:signal recognition particle protein n=1 Tax=Mycoplasma leonicaptivi TaxID=36742 RepID=UPI000480840F|nr:signal recognition particle protein [Mycoplasma leonicaptivi]